MTRVLRVAAKGASLHVRVDGADRTDAPTVVFSNSLGSDTALWDQVIARLPEGLRLVRYDMRGHGLSDKPAGPYAMGTLVADAETVCDALDIRDAMFVGLSVGGMVGQGLAIKRLDLIRALVLACTAAKIGTPDRWQARIDTVLEKGMSAIVDDVLQLWFARDFLADADRVAPWRRMLSEADPVGYAGVCAAIAGTDFYTPTSGLRLPTLGIAGSEDQSTPPDLVRETVDLIPGSEFRLIRRAGHLPPVDQPAVFADLLSDFIAWTGHMTLTERNG